MGFKNKKIEKSNSKILKIFWAIVIFIIMWIWVLSINAVDKLLWVSKYKTWSWIVKTDEKTWEKIFKKEINVLMIWRWWNENDAPQLTDSIILAKINKEKNTVALLSIQRDLYVNYATEKSPNEKWHWKINSLYSYYYSREWKDESKAIVHLKEKIKDITWEEVDYYVNIDFAGFRNIIDSIGWIEIDVKKSFIDREYPTKNWWYQTVSFEKWIQKMDWETALKYARSRHSTSDYDRSLRQQQVIQAIKNKITTKEWLSETNISWLFWSLMKNFTTDVSLNDAVSLTKDLEFLSKNYDFISSNFNDSCASEKSICEKWWIIYTPKRDLFWGSWVSLIDWSTPYSLSKYEKSKKYSNIVLNFPKVSVENYEIMILNWTNTAWAWKFVNWLKKYWFNTNYANVKNAPESHEKTVIYYNWISSESDTIKALKEFFKWEIIKTSEPKFILEWKEIDTNRSKIKIEIVIWSDYFKNKEIFNF